ncbi:hypothetical protein EQH57_0301 [Dictyocoela roeselum]|nr:hypothetical protein EQH57_0301 [Dictyocoela roeselum]
MMRVRLSSSCWVAFLVLSVRSSSLMMRRCFLLLGVSSVGSTDSLASPAPSSSEDDEALRILFFFFGLSGARLFFFFTGLVGFRLTNRQEKRINKLCGGQMPNILR